MQKQAISPNFIANYLSINAFKMPIISPSSEYNHLARKNLNSLEIISICPTDPDGLQNGQKT